MSERDHMRKIWGFHPPLSLQTREDGNLPPPPPPPPPEVVEAWAFFYGKYR